MLYVRLSEEYVVILVHLFCILEYLFLFSPVYSFRGYMCMSKLKVTGFA